MADNMNNELESPPEAFQPDRFQSLQFAAEGSQVGMTTQYDARVSGGGVVLPPIPGTSPTPERQPTPGNHRVRDALIATGAAVSGVAAVVGGLLGVDKMRSGDDSGSDNSEVTRVVTQVDAATNTPVEVKSPTLAPTEKPSPTSEATPRPDSPPTYGKYKSVEEMPISSELKRNIAILLEGSTPFIFVENAIVTIENDTMTRETTKTFLGEVVPAEQIHSIELNTGRIPDAAQKLERAVERAKYEAYKAHSKDDNLTFEEYLAQKKQRNFPFFLRAYEGKSERPRYMQVEEPEVVIIRITAQPEKSTIISSTTIGGYFEHLPGVISANVWSTTPGSVDNYDPKRGRMAQIQIANRIDSILADMSDTTANANIPDPTNKISQATYLNLLAPITHAIAEDTIPIRTSEEFDSIFRVTGKPVSR